MTKRKPKPAPVVFDQAMLDRAYEAAQSQSQIHSFIRDPHALLIAAIEAALNTKYQGTRP